MGFCDKPVKPSKPRKKREPYKGRKPLTGRVRSRSQVFQPFAKVHTQATPHMEQEIVPVTYKRYEKIVDTVGFMRKWQNPCTHVKFDATDLVRPSNLRLEWNCNVGADTAQLPNTFTMLPSLIEEIPTHIIHGVTNSAMRHFLETVEPRVLLLNFLLEIIELVKSVVAKGDEWLEKLKIIQQRLAAELKRLAKRGIFGAEAYFLAWSFAIKPFIGDMKEILCSIQNARKRMDWLLHHAGKPVRVQFRAEDIWPQALNHMWAGAGSAYYGAWNPACPPWTPPCAQPESSGLVGSYLLRLTEAKVDFTAQATVVYSLPPFRFSNGNGLGYVWASMMAVDRLGSFVWEAIPFSFVIDWFTNVGKEAAAWLDDKTKKFSDGEILETGFAFKSSYKAELLYFEDEVLCGTRDMQSLGFVSFDYYVRDVGLPEAGFVLDPGGALGGTRPALSVALAVQRWKRFKKRWRRLARR